MYLNYKYQVKIECKKKNVYIKVNLVNYTFIILCINNENRH